jgi:hypothetical protein
VSTALAVCVQQTCHAAQLWVLQGVFNHRSAGSRAHVGVVDELQVHATHHTM